MISEYGVICHLLETLADTTALHPYCKEYLGVRITEREDRQNESSGTASPREQMMNLPQFYVIAGLISWQPFIRQNDKGFEALVEIIFLCCLVNTGESGWTGTVVI